MLQTFCRIKPSFFADMQPSIPNASSALTWSCCAASKISWNLQAHDERKLTFSQHATVFHDFQKKTWLQDKTVWVPMRTCEILPHKSWQPMDRRSLRKNAATSSVAKHVQEDDLFERLDQALWSGRDINFLEVRRNVYTGPLHISILVSELTFSNDIVTLCLWPWYSTPSFCFGSLFICMNEYNSIPKKAAKISMPKLCVCIICSSQSFKFSNLLLILELFVTQILHSYTLDLVDLNGVVGQELQGDSLLLTYQLMGLLCNSCFCWKLGYAALTQWSQPCLLGLRHLFIRYLHQRGLVT